MDSRGAGVSGGAGGVDRRAREYCTPPDGMLRQRQPPVAASKSATASARRPGRCRSCTAIAHAGRRLRSDRHALPPSG